ncbi:LuxR C-terminal-related transcriptional regulator [Streptomyces sp. NPDC049597]|uniref:LuxR C-terminal-related transcriptional regulator n=1 Tax=Streptomyces sp. NPDC049597 TaxID=3155276 RepID=UPI003434DC3E
MLALSGGLRRWATWTRKSFLLRIEDAAAGPGRRAGCRRRTTSLPTGCPMHHFPLEPDRATMADMGGLVLGRVIDRTEKLSTRPASPIALPILIRRWPRTSKWSASWAKSSPCWSPMTPFQGLGMYPSSLSASLGLPWPFVGREKELGAFDATVRISGMRGVLMLGPAGVGKSRLARECWDRAVDAGWSGARMKASAAAASVPLGAFAHLLPSGVDLSDPPAVFRAATSSFRPGGGRRFLLLIDDVHLLDATSAMLVSQLLDAASVFLVATARDHVPAPDAVAAIDRADGLLRINVPPLDSTATETVLSAVLGGVVERRTVIALQEAGEGNPLFLRELVIGAVEQGDLISEDHVWRLTGPVAATACLTQEIQTRVSVLPSACLRLVELLSLVGPVGVGELEAPDDEALETLERTGFIRVQMVDRRIMVELAHPLYAEVVRRRIPVLRQRRILSRHIERVLAFGARRQSDVLRIATWQISAGLPADPGLLVHAAGLARHGHDYHQVLGLLDAVPDGHQTIDTRLLRGEALYQLGRYEQAERTLAHAYAVAVSDEERTAVTIERTQNLCWGTCDLPKALAVNLEARTRTGDVALRAALGVNEGAMRVLAGMPDQGLQQLEDIGDAADDRVRLYGLGMKVLGLATVGRTAEAVELGQRVHEEHLRASEHIVIQHHSAALSALALAHAASGDLQSARATAERGHQAAVGAGAKQPGVWLAWGLARTHWLAGRPADARRWYAESLALARSEPVPIILRLAASGLAAASAVLGDEAGARNALDGFDSYPRFPFLSGEDRLGEAWILASQGLVQPAQEVLLEAADQARAMGYVTSEMLLLTEAARLGAADRVHARLRVLAAQSDGRFAAVRSSFATALATQDAVALDQVVEELRETGAFLLAAEAAAAAAHGHARKGDGRRAARAATVSASLRAHCQGACSPGLAGAAGAEPLTARQREIALLASRGVQSQEIAKHLVLSVRTVDNHLQHIYRKLGITRRSQLPSALDLLHPGRPS